VTLHVDVHGSGAPLVLLHGWGMHSGIWDTIVPQLAPHVRVHCVDLPGHGYSKLPSPVYGRGAGEEGAIDEHSLPPLVQPLTPTLSCLWVEQLDVIVDELSAQFDGPLNVCGWSLGGLVALRWARRVPRQVKRLVLVASTPCFTERQDWPFGMGAETLRQFAAELERDHAATLRRFLALQLRGSANERELLADVRSRLFIRGEPDINALRAGLEILRDADLRGDLSAIRQPSLLIAGNRDKLTPSSASVHMAQKLPDARLVEIDDAAHVPFLSHPEIFVTEIADFLHG